jgi:hypothetical protein
MNTVIVLLMIEGQRSCIIPCMQNDFLDVVSQDSIRFFLTLHILRRNQNL